ncbi:putative paraoxonase [Xylariaceae sp. FL0016]|nr:putative paraoxonase [Xylariaceae sp. FL0016]
MALKIALTTLALACLSPFLWERAQVLSLFWYNAPERLVRIDEFGSHEIKFSDRIRSCEDVVLVESVGVAILACDPGRERWNTVMGVFEEGSLAHADLYIYDYKDTEASEELSLKRVEFVDFKHEVDFHTLGLAFDESSSTLYATSHRHDQPAIEMFKLDLTAHTAKHLRSIQHELLHGPNAIAIINNHEFYVTNNNHFLVADHPFLNHVETYLGLPGGTVVHVDIMPQLVDPSSPVQANVVKRVPFANGIEIINQTTLAVASSSHAAVYFFDVTAPTAPNTAPTLTHASKLRVPFMADNLSLSKDGRLMIAGHPHIISLSRFAKSRHVCNDPASLASASPQLQLECAKFTAPSWVAEWTPEGGLKSLYADTEYPSSATAVRDADRKVGIVAGLYAKGVMVWTETR